MFIRKKKIVAPPATWFKRISLISRHRVMPHIGRDYGFTAPSLTIPGTTRLVLHDHWTYSNITQSLIWDNATMAVTLTLAANARSSVPTEHPGKISSGPTTLFGVPGITGHTICRTLKMQNIWPMLDLFPASTVEPLIYDPPQERPPAIYDHISCRA